MSNDNDKTNVEQYKEVTCEKEKIKTSKLLKSSCSHDNTLLSEICCCNIEVTFFTQLHRGQHHHSSTFTGLRLNVSGQIVIFITCNRQRTGTQHFISFITFIIMSHVNGFHICQWMTHMSMDETHVNRCHMSQQMSHVSTDVTHVDRCHTFMHKIQ